VPRAPAGVAAAPGWAPAARGSGAEVGAERRWRGVRPHVRVDEVREPGIVIHPRHAELGQAEELDGGLRHAGVGGPAVVDPGAHVTAEHDQRHARAERELHIVGRVLGRGRSHVIVKAAPVVIREQERRLVPATAPYDGIDRLPHGVHALGHVRGRVLVGGAVVPQVDERREPAGLGVGDEVRARDDVGRPLQLGVEGDGIAVRRGVAAPGHAVVLRQPGDRRHVPEGWRLPPGGVAQRRRLASDEEQVVRRRVRSETRAVIRQEGAGHRQIQVVRQHRSGVELDVRAGGGARQPSEIRVTVVRLIVGRGIG
jgi:hypothetical protein